jgi:hypothetical protein
MKKKKKENKNKKKSRQLRIGLAFDSPATITGIRENDDGSITLLGLDGKPLAVPTGFSGSAYDRPKGAKVTFQIPDQGESIGSLCSVLARYDRIIGVDTNSRKHDGEDICVTAVCQLRNLKYEGVRWLGRLESLWALEFRQPTKLPERIGWRHVLAQGDEQRWLKNGSTLLLVVDAYLNDLHQINERKLALIDDFLLPKGASIAYASSDSASDSPLNALIAHCDKVAREVLNHVTRASSPASSGPLLSAERTPFRTYRYWKFKE